MADSGNNFQLTPEQMQQHPEVALLLFILTMVFITMFFGCIVLWGMAIQKWRKGEKLLEVKAWTPRVWGLIDLFVVGIIVVLGQLLSLKIWASMTAVDMQTLRAEEDFPISAMAAGSASYLVAVGLTILWLKIRYGITMSHVGFGISRLGWNLMIGLAAAVMVLPLVNIVMVLVSQGFNEDYKHPLLEKMMSEGSIAAFLLAAFAAAVAAPIAEEFLFRVLLQGWLQSIPQSLSNLQWLTGASHSDRAVVAESQKRLANPQLVLADGVVIEDSIRNPYSAPLAAEHNLPPPLLDNPIQLPEVSITPPPLWPVFVSGTLFGLAHWGYGLSFVPLILLGIVLGLLYRAKQSIWPCLVVHFTLNFLAILGLGLNMLLKHIAP